jgi:PiT family inorganic phosphate transporter
MSASSEKATLFGVFAIILVGAIYAGYHLIGDLTSVPAESFMPYLLLGVALLIALGFEFVNGFHDTANAVATVIYTRSMPAHIAVVWSGVFNLIGVLLSTGGVAFGIISLLPVELILNVGSSAGFAMVFALLIAAIIWNLGTWALGIPNSSSHALVGSIIGVGLMNAWLSPTSGTAGVDWNQVYGVGRALAFSPLVGFVLSALLLLLSKAMIRIPKLYAEPKGDEAPPLWIRGLLILTCTGVSFAHGSNDGQKGMGLIMLILIGCVPTAYALNHAVGASDTPAFVQTSNKASAILAAHGGNDTVKDPKATLSDTLRTKTVQAGEISAMNAMVQDVSKQISAYGAVGQVPPDKVSNVRNDMYLLSENIAFIKKHKAVEFSAAEWSDLDAYKKQVDGATKFIPTWVKVAVAIALGLGTMIGWKRIVVTVGEKIGKTHLTYAQGAAAEIVAAGTIILADQFSLPVSTTHILSSGVAGTMAANRSGLQMATIRNLIMAWVLTLPAAITLSGGLYFIFRQLF